MRNWCAVLCVSLLMCARVSAQDAVMPDKLSLAEAIRIAVERNPSLAASQGDVAIAEADRLDVSRRLNPAVTVDSTGYPLFDAANPISTSNQQVVVRVDQELELAGRRRLRISAANAGVDGARARVDNARRLLTLEVQRAYFQAALARADREVSTASLAEIDRAISLNRGRFEQGEISGGELRRLQVERLKFVDDVFAAELAFRNSRSLLLALLNVADLGQDFDVTDPLAAPTGTPLIAAGLGINVQTPAAATLTAEALVNRPDVVASQREVVRAETETRLQRALRTPNITVGGGYTRFRGSSLAVFGATVPLPLFNRNQGGLARAAAVRVQAANRTRAAENVVRLEVQQAINGLAISQERVRYIEREYLTTARESRDIVEASYRAGASDLIDFLDAQRAFRDTVRTYNRALYEQRVSLFELVAAAALPGQE